MNLDPAMTDRQPEPNMGFLLADVARLMRRNFDRRAQQIGLSRAQWQVLAWLKRNEGISQAALADLLEMSPMTLVRLIDKLEAAGLVQRRPKPGDRRSYQLYLADHAHPLLDRLWEMGAETRHQAQAGMSKAQEAMLIDMLHMIRRNLVEADSDSANRPVKLRAVENA
jgi:MarR family transcriptional regulator, transcriptional regulator for hemolysin